MLVFVICLSYLYYYLMRYSTQCCSTQCAFLYKHYKTKVGGLLTNKTVSCLKAISVMRAFLICDETDHSTVNFHLQKRLVFYHKLTFLYQYHYIVKIELIFVNVVSFAL